MKIDSRGDRNTGTIRFWRASFRKETLMPIEQKPSGNPDLIKQHKEKQRLGEKELANKPGKEPAHGTEETNSSGDTGEGGTQP
jgi:hypothetical protein